MNVLQLFLACAADLKARNWAKLATDAAALLQALAANQPVKASAASCRTLAAGCSHPAITVSPVGPDDLADEIEQFVANHAPKEGLAAAAPALPPGFWQNALALLLKILPLLIGG